jgi:Restriction endonuclease NaeI
LAKVEKTYIGTKIEIVIQDAFGLERGGAHGMDYLVVGEQVDCKWSMSMGKWMIPKEAVGELCLVVWADDQKSVFSVGLIRASGEVLKTGANQDGKRYLSAEGLDSIVWLADRAALPENLLLHISGEDRTAIFAPKSGQARVDELFRRIQGRIVRREVVLAVARQLDSPKRVRDARLHLGAEGIRILGHEDADRAEAAARGLPMPDKGEWVSYLASD